MSPAIELGHPVRGNQLPDGRRADRFLGGEAPVALATAHQAAGNRREALEGHRRAAAACRRVLGPDHPDTLGALNNLADAHAETGDRGTAVEMYERLLADCRRVFGAGDQRTRWVATNLAAVRRRPS
ncbi:tetratricopeptide repeat protein [Streptomyces sp. NPDC050674]|uniref:tetratricopeptide repeat protein n=1 Tax=Streptomyces sp. NPDC050674 TaxID=3157216 RepID=UPI00344A9092